MPRIAAALAVVATLAFCIGFNVARYPAVWEMAATSGQVSRSDEPVQSTAFPQLAHAGQSQPGVEPQTTPEPSPDSEWKTSWGSTPVEPIASYPGDAEGDASPGWTEGAPVVAAIANPMDAADVSGYQAEPSDPPPALDRPASRPDVITYPTGEPIEVLPSMKYASSAVGPPADDPPESYPSEELNSERPLVPVTIAGEANGAAGSPDAGAGEDPPAAAGRFGADVVVQRLPPIDEVWNDPAAGEETLLPERPIPIYPTTGVE